MMSARGVQLSMPSPVRGVSEDRAIAMLFVEQNAAAARRAVRLTNVTNELELIRKRKAAADAKRAELADAHAVAVGALEQAAEKTDVVKVVWFSLASVLFVSALLGGGFLLLIFAAVAAFLGLLRASGTIGQLSALSAECEARAAALSEDDEGREDFDGEIARREAELAGGIPAPAVPTIGVVSIGLHVRDVAGERVLVDPGWGLGREVVASIPNVGEQMTALGFVQEAIEATIAPPMLLEPGEQHTTVDQGLHGEERTLRAAVESLAQVVENTEIRAVTLPLVGWDGQVALACKASKPGAPAGLYLAKGLGDRIEEDIVFVNEGVSALAADESLQLLGMANKMLAERLSVYAKLRNDALDVMHTRFLDAMGRASLLSVDYMDPRQAMVPEYWFQQIGVDPERAHELELDELLARLSADPDVKRRLDTSPALVQALQNTYAALQTIQAHASSGASAGQTAALEAQAEQELRSFRASVHEALTGNRSGRVEVSSASRLELDPVQKHWVSAVDGRVYDEADAAYGRILRAQRELMLPMWNALWVEQEQFRKSELFRTNESLQRMAEKESEKILAVAESYKADLRPVREKLITHATEAETKMTQLHDSIDAMQQLGQIPNERAAQLRANVQAIGSRSITDAKREAEQKELVLSMEPAHQLARRGTAADPIHMLLAPSVLYVASDNSDRLALAAPGAAQALLDQATTRRLAPVEEAVAGPPPIPATERLTAVAARGDA